MAISKSVIVIGRRLKTATGPETDMQKPTKISTAEKDGKYYKVRSAVAFFFAGSPHVVNRPGYAHTSHHSLLPS